jgi:shikimate dehydrogenase
MSNTQPEIDGQIQLLFVVGDPIAHARSPRLLNELLARKNIHAILLPLRVSPKNVELAIRSLRIMDNVKGAIVTMPHKSTVLDYLDEISNESKVIGACNVVRRSVDGSLHGSNVDGDGFVLGLANHGYNVAGKHVFLAGAGGAAAAIAYALGKHGAASLTLHNRTQRKAHELVHRVRNAWRALKVSVGTDTPAPTTDLVVNGTSLGMRDGDEFPINIDGLNPRMTAAEVIMVPERTPFLRAAAEHGCPVHGGEPMLLAQLELMIDFLRLQP